MTNVKVKKGDTVVLLAGKDRGKQGKVVRVLPREQRLVVDGLNLVKKHRRARRASAPAGIVTLAAPLPIARVMVVCPHCHKPTRVAMRLDQDGQKSRICKHCAGQLHGKEA